MRMDTEDGERITAEYIVNNFTEEQLANIIWKVNALVESVSRSDISLSMARSGIHGRLQTR
mgnify:CR=1 FL=1